MNRKRKFSFFRFFVFDISKNGLNRATVIILPKYFSKWCQMTVESPERIKSILIHLLKYFDKSNVVMAIRL